MLPAPDGGGAIPVLLDTQIAGLRRRHEVTVVTGIGDESWEVRAAEALINSGLDLHLGDRRRPPPGRDRWERRIQLGARWARGLWPWRTVWFATATVQAALDELGRHRAFDVIAVEDSSMAMLDLPRGAATVLTEHEVRWPRGIDWRAGPPHAWPRWMMKEVDWRRWPEFQRSCWRRFDRVQVFTERDARAIRAIAPDVAPRVRVNPFGLRPQPRSEPTNAEPGTVLFVGNFSHPPNRDAARWLAGEIMPVVRRRYPGAKLRIVGTHPPSDILELAGPGVEVVADADDLAAQLEAACVVAAPVRIGGGMRMKILHALASGKAVVTTSRGGEGYTYTGSTPPFITADDTDSFASATAELLADAQARGDLERRGRAFADSCHSVDAWVTRLEAVYAEARNLR